MNFNLIIHLENLRIEKLYIKFDVFFVKTNSKGIPKTLLGIKWDPASWTKIIYLKYKFG